MIEKVMVNKDFVPKFLESYIYFPNGFVVGISEDIKLFENKLKKTIKSSLPITIGCDKDEFIDCLEFLNIIRSISVLPYELHVEMKESDLIEFINNSSNAIHGYIGIDENVIQESFRKIDFTRVIGIHVFLIERSVSFDSFCNHLYLKPLKYREIDGIVSLYLWSKLNDKEFDFNRATHSVCSKNYENSSDLFDLYLKENEVSKNKSYKGLTYEEAKEQFERSFFLEKYQEFECNISNASKASGVSRNNFKEKVRKFS